MKITIVCYFISGISKTCHSRKKIICCNHRKTYEKEINADTRRTYEDLHRDLKSNNVPVEYEASGISVAAKL
jgi:hypothetical protein